MTRENKPEAPAEKRNEYAYWAIPGAAVAVTYSLPLFHEIDFAVNEGYRKIPRGGIEEGGLLFGVIDEKGTRIDAFRPIVCEHSSGPSFLLSDHDLEGMQAQMEACETDPELEGLHVVGWFLAHTRGPLTLTDREADLCDHYFAHPGMVTMLVKPERFQPTRFGFLVRGTDGSLPRDGAKNAIILPLPGRAPKPGSAPVASIPAPAVNASAVRRAAEADNATTAENDDEVSNPPSKPKVALPPTVSEKVPQADLSSNRAAKRQPRLSLDQVRPKSEENAGPSTESKPSAGEAEKNDEVLPARRGVSDIEPARRTGGLTAGRSTGAGLSTVLRPVPGEELDLDLPNAYRQAQLQTQKRPASSTARMVMVLPLAALLGCLVGWLAFLQVPPPIIPLSIKARGENVVVTWPPEQTRGALYAAVRVDDSSPVPLTAEEKTTGRVEVQARPDMKVELIARNWIRDSRGIVHYVRPVANTAP